MTMLIDYAEQNFTQRKGRASSVVVVLLTYGMLVLAAYGLFVLIGQLISQL